MELLFPIPDGKLQRKENGSWQAYLWSPRRHVEMNYYISCLHGNRKWNCFCLFLKENSRDKKMEIVKHIYVVPGDMLKRIISFPVCQETGNGTILPIPEGK